MIKFEEAGFKSSNGFKLGEEVELKFIEGKKLKTCIVGFDINNTPEKIIVIDFSGDKYDKFEVGYADFILLKGVDSKAFFKTINPEEIDFIIKYGAEAKEYLRKNRHNHIWSGEDIEKNKIVFTDYANKVKCLLDTEEGFDLIEEIRKKNNEEILGKIRQYEVESVREQAEKAEIKVKDKSEYNQCKHYSNTGIEPIEFIMKNKYGFSQGNIVKYNHRVGKKKGEEADDIIKIIDYAMLLSYEKGIEVKEEDLIELVKYRSQWIKERKNDR